MATGHSYADTVTKPTCTATGYTTHTCTTCGDTYKDSYVGATGHAWNEGVEVVKAGCSVAGERVFTCRNCGETKSEEIAPLGHSYKAVITAPTCSKGGYTTYTCSVCGYSYKDSVVEASGHEWDNGVVTTAPTSTSEGVKTYTCLQCAQTKTEAIEKLHVCDGGAGCPSKRFTDVAGPNDWTHKGIDYAVANGLFSGMSNTTFEPDTAMTRAMLVTVLWRYAGKPMEGTNNFVDVQNGQWYTDEVTWAAHNGIVAGVGNGKFDPEGKITREQMAAILYRYAGKVGIDTSERTELTVFPDANKISGSTENGATYLRPQGNATRAQVAAILMRFIENLATNR